EWLVTNGIGGFASSSVVGCNTRRYHALLCAATNPPLGRMVLVHKSDDTVTVNGRSYDLGCNQYPGTVHPAGFQYLTDFVLDPLPRWTYSVPGAQIQRTVWMPYGENRTVVRYDLLEGDEVVLTTRPYVSGRDYHGIHRYNETINTATQRSEQNGCHIRMQTYEGSPPIVFSHSGDFFDGGAWYHSFEYEIERERGLDFVEDAYSPGAWVWTLTRQNPTAYFVVATEASDLQRAAASQQDELARCANLTSKSTTENGADSVYDFRDRLALAADQFIVQRESDGLHTVLAGYPWFSDWGRDTMIALPGLCLSTGRYDIARSILLAFAKSASQGMIPNRFPDAGDTPDYNTVDATLWFFHAVAQYVEASGDWKTLEESLYPVLRDCIDWHLRGTRYGIKADETDGLLNSGSSATQLTWMDAKVGDTVFTPRAGKPVEIQALWFNALKNMMHFADHCGDAATKKLCGAWSRKVKANFTTLFWNEETGALYDYVSADYATSGYRDSAIRPNQIFVVSLPHRLLSVDLEKRVVATVQRELLTPVGLRSLSPSDSQYRGIYLGDQWQRDSS
ncbi:MAG TPA: amylo-alpha-1,6-glucosidase, partial [Abditibacteriaceae bacterium]